LGDFETPADPLIFALAGFKFNDGEGATGALTFGLVRLKMTCG
jgi:hypothetical protein